MRPDKAQKDARSVPRATTVRLVLKSLSNVSMVTALQGLQPHCFALPANTRTPNSLRWCRKMTAFSAPRVNIAQVVKSEDRALQVTSVTSEPLHQTISRRRVSEDITVRQALSFQSGAPTATTTLSWVLALVKIASHVRLAITASRTTVSLELARQVTTVVQ